MSYTAKLWLLAQSGPPKCYESDAAAYFTGWLHGVNGNGDVRAIPPARVAAWTRGLLDGNGAVSDAHAHASTNYSDTPE